MDDDTSSSQPIADLKQTMAMDMAEHSDVRMTPEILASQQKNDLRTLLTKTAVFLVCLFALSALVFMILDGLQFSWFDLSDSVLVAYLVVALSPTSAYFIRKIFTVGMDV